MSIVEEFYDQNAKSEWQRLERHRTEFSVTMRALLEYLPPTPANILDIGGGPGRYSIALTQIGYDVSLIDISESNIKLAKQKAKEAGISLAGYTQTNATSLKDFASTTFDSVLLLGPLYHLLLREDRKKAIDEAHRVLRNEGTFFAAFITRFAPFRNAAKNHADWVTKDPDYTQQLLQTGIHNNQDVFTNAYFAHPDEIIPLMEISGFQTTNLIGCEGAIANNEEYVNQLSGRDWDNWVESNYEIGKDPSMRGASDHLLYIGRKLTQ
jgi:ubiquinone/menaquinone biosynthesis C-methylase UbiE